MSSDHVLYRFFDQEDQLLYIGISNDPKRRFSEHRQGKLWWRKASRIQLEHFGGRDELAAAEIRAIQNESPRYNNVYATSGSVEYIRSGRAFSVSGHDGKVSATGHDANRMGSEVVDRNYEDATFQYIYGSCITCGASHLAQPIDIDGHRTNSNTYCFRCTSSWADEDHWLIDLLAAP